MRKSNLAVAVLFATIFITTSCGNVEEHAPQPVEYKLLTIENSELSLPSSYSAAIRGKQDIDILPQVGGYLSKVNVIEGDKVKKGDVLFVIEQAPYKAAYEAAKAGVEVAKAGVATAQLNYDNSLLLNQRKITSDSELQSFKNALTSAKAQLSLAKAQESSAKVNLDFTVIKSPSNGVVGKLPYRQGALVSASLAQALTTVSDNSEMYVYFSMNEKQVLDLVDEYGAIDSVIVNMPEVELELINGTTYAEKGKLESISGVIDNGTGAVSMRVVFPNDNQRLISGGAGNIIIHKTYNDAIVIPKAATVEIQNKTFVYRIVDGVTKSTPIEVASSSNDTEFVVTQGLSAGDIIVAEGAGLVREGTAVKQ
ncbi:MAG: efflux RND transporter periplasmic adaptor subunit [Rikenellaceae bacterium]